MITRKLFGGTACLLLLVSLSMSQTRPPSSLCVGVYDSRAIAIAYARSEMNPVAAKVAELKKAKAAGDSAKVKVLEAWGQKQQRKLHRQGFGRVPVDDLLLLVKDKLAAVASSARVNLLIPECNYLAPGVEVIDVTDALAALFNPTGQTLEIIKQMKGVAPVDLDDIGD